jgi:hypothetical protein
MAVSRHWIALCLLLTCSLAGFETAGAQPPGRFDLAGPKIDIRVTRGDVTLPIAAVPNLQPNDVLWLHPDFPPTQSVHYLLIVAFLRGTTNPPPDNWFTRIETWQKSVREEGVFINVPPEAQQAILFLAPETGGDFSTLRSAVKGQPGTFVRASQDLTEAGFEQARIEKYLEEIKKVPPADTAALLEHSNLLARTLALKPNPECFKRPVDQQYTCLTQTGTQTLLDDGHGQSVVAALSNGPTSDFINAASYTQVAGGGNYSAYVGAIVDLLRLTSTLHTAQYHYIPAISYPESAEDSATAPGETLNLRLNTPPSFHNPKSVIVIGLPSVQKVVLPPLRPADPNHISCLLDPHMVLPIEGAPLVFSTDFAHDLVLHLNLPEDPGNPGKNNLPIVPDAYQGGLALDQAPKKRKELSLNPNDPDPITPFNQPASPTNPTQIVKPSVPGAPITGTIEGYWGFDRYTGPTLPLQNVPGQGWRLIPSGSPSGDQPAATLIAGQPNHLQLDSTGTSCVEEIALEPGDNKVDWKLAPPPPPPNTPLNAEAPPAPAPVIPPVRPIEITLNLQHATTPGNIRLAIQQFGEKEPDQLGSKTFAQPARIESLRLHAGDITAVLTGDSLSQVKDLTLDADRKELKEMVWTPAPAGGGDQPGNHLLLTLPNDARPPNLKPNEKIVAQVHLRDGRTLETSTYVLPERPEIEILSRRAVAPAPSSIQLASPEDLPLGDQLIFFLKSKEKFPRNEQIEISSKDGGDPASQSDPALKTTLSISAGSLILQDNHTVLATFDPLKTFGPSTFGQFRVRAVTADGTNGDWLPLATIVRLPTLTQLHCPVSSAQPCQLSGSALYLIDAISPDPDFNQETPVPEGFVDPTLSIPHPITTGRVAANTPATFYLRLRDDPANTDTVTLPMELEPGSGRHTASPASTTPMPPAETPTSPTPIAPAPATPSRSSAHSPLSRSPASE